MIGHDGIGFYAACDVCRREFFRDNTRRHYAREERDSILPDLHSQGWIVTPGAYDKESRQTSSSFEKHYCPDCIASNADQRLHSLEYCLHEALCTLINLANGAGATAMPYDTKGMRRIAKSGLDRMLKSIWMAYPVMGERIENTLDLRLSRDGEAILKGYVKQE